MNQRYSREPYEQSNRNQGDYRRYEERGQESGRQGWDQSRDQDFGVNYSTSADEWRGTGGRVFESGRGDYLGRPEQGRHERYAQGGPDPYRGGQGSPGQWNFGDVGGGRYDPQHPNFGQQNYGQQNYDQQNYGQQNREQYGRSQASGNFGSGRGGQDWGSNRPQGPAFGQGERWSGGQMYNESAGFSRGQQHDDYDQGRMQFGSMREEPSHAWGSGKHQGRGPKGYQRTDERIQEDLCERLCDDAHIDASEVTINVKAGVVTLEGSVDSRATKHRIEDIADSCSGVKDIQNHLSVASGKTTSMGESEKSKSSSQEKDQSRQQITEH